MKKGVRYPIAFVILILTVLIIVVVNVRRHVNRDEKPVYKVQFHFRNMQHESGIIFRHHPTPDSGRHYTANHYDHGMGILVADVDNDGFWDVYFLNQIGSNALYKNLGNGRFEDITEISGTGVTDRVSVGGSFVDIDNDGDQDLFVTTVRKGNILFENNGKGVFTDITRKSGLEYKGHSSSSVFFDFDNDGFLDLFLVNVGRYTTDDYDEQGYYIGYGKAFLLHLQKGFQERSTLYKNSGNGQFKDVSKDMGLEVWGWNGDASIVDYNNDAYPDLYICDMQGDDQFFENVKGKYFKNVTSAIFPKTAWGTMGVKFFDYNNDLLIDLMTTDMHSDMAMNFREEEEKVKLPPESAGPQMGDISNNILGNSFYKNLGGGAYQEISDEIGVETYWPWGISVGDLNADGYQDVFLPSGMGYPFRYGKNVLLINEKGEKFKDSEFEFGIEPRVNGNIIHDFFKVDCGGVDQGRRECRDDFNNGQNCLVNGVCYKDGYVSGVRSSRSSAILDIDNDGDLDIITNGFNDFPQVFISDLAQRNEINYLKVKSVGTTSNKNAIGAKVAIFYDDRRQVQYVDAKSGYLSQSQIPLYFGLGNSQTVDRIEILWPSGAKQVIDRNIVVNRLMEVTEPR